MLFSAAMKNRKYLFSFSDDEISSSPSKARHSRQKKIVSSKHSLFQISEVKTTIMPLQQPSFLDLEPIPLSGWSSSVQDHDTQTRNDRPLPSSVIGALDEAIQLFDHDDGLDALMSLDDMTSLDTLPPLWTPTKKMFFEEEQALKNHKTDIAVVPLEDSLFEMNQNNVELDSVLNSSQGEYSITGPSVVSPDGQTAGKWYKRFEELRSFRKESGHSNIPTRWSQNPALAQWVKRQRYQYKLKMEGKHSTMTEDRQKLLEGLDFVWDSHSNFWEDRLIELEAFREKYGHCNIPTRFPENPRLAIWAKVQRRQFKLFCTKGSRIRSNMTLERISRLSKLGFVFNPREVKQKMRPVTSVSIEESLFPVKEIGNLVADQDRPTCPTIVLETPQSKASTKSASMASLNAHQTEKWYERYEELCAFHQANGHCSVPTGWIANPSLAQWVKRQRYQYKLKKEGKHSTMTPEREKLLGNLGFVWDSHANFWEDRLIELKSFRERHGHCNVPTKYPEDPRLAIWAKDQRRQFKLFCMEGSRKRSNMTLERISRLSKLGFVFNPRELKQKKSE